MQQQMSTHKAHANNGEACATTSSFPDEFYSSLEDQWCRLTLSDGFPKDGTNDVVSLVKKVDELATANEGEPPKLSLYSFGRSTGRNSTDLTATAPLCDISFPSSRIKMSRHHANIFYQQVDVPGGCYFHVLIEDHSRNGTYINRLRIPKAQPVPIRHGDTISFGTGGLDEADHINANVSYCASIFGKRLLRWSQRPACVLGAELCKLYNRTPQYYSEIASPWGKLTYEDNSLAFDLTKKLPNDPADGQRDEQYVHLIGRGKRCDWIAPLEAKSISKEHCKIYCIQGIDDTGGELTWAAFIEDISRHGLTVNDEALTKTCPLPLLGGDIIRFPGPLVASTVLCYTDLSANAADSPVVLIGSSKHDNGESMLQSPNGVASTDIHKQKGSNNRIDYVQRYNSSQRGLSREGDYADRAKDQEAEVEENELEEEYSSDKMSDENGDEYPYVKKRQRTLGSGPVKSSGSKKKAKGLQPTAHARQQISETSINAVLLLPAANPPVTAFKKKAPINKPVNGQSIKLSKEAPADLKPANGNAAKTGTTKITKKDIPKSNANNSNKKPIKTPAVPVAAAAEDVDVPVSTYYLKIVRINVGVYSGYLGKITSEHELATGGYRCNVLLQWEPRFMDWDSADNDKLPELDDLIIRGRTIVLRSWGFELINPSSIEYEISLAILKHFETKQLPGGSLNAAHTPNGGPSTKLSRAAGLNRLGRTHSINSNASEPTLDNDDEEESRNNLYWADEFNFACVWYGSTDRAVMENKSPLVYPIMLANDSSKPLTFVTPVTVPRHLLKPLDSKEITGAPLSDQRLLSFLLALLDFSEWDDSRRYSYFWPDFIVDLMANPLRLRTFIDHAMTKIPLRFHYDTADTSKYLLTLLCAHHLGLAHEYLFQPCSSYCANNPRSSECVLWDLDSALFNKFTANGSGQGFPCNCITTQAFRGNPTLKEMYTLEFKELAEDVINARADENEQPTVMRSCCEYGNKYQAEVPVIKDVLEGLSAEDLMVFNPNALDDLSIERYLKMARLIAELGLRCGQRVQTLGPHIPASYASGSKFRSKKSSASSTIEEPSVWSLLLSWNADNSIVDSHNQDKSDGGIESDDGCDYGTGNEDDDGSDHHDSVLAAQCNTFIHGDFTVENIALLSHLRLLTMWPDLHNDREFLRCFSKPAASASHSNYNNSTNHGINNNGHAINSCGVVRTGTVVRIYLKPTAPVNAETKHSGLSGDNIFVELVDRALPWSVPLASCRILSFDEDVALAELHSHDYDVPAALVSWHKKMQVGPQVPHSIADSPSIAQGEIDVKNE